MLTQKQWQWLADHHLTVQRWSWNAVALALVVYAGLIGKTMLDKGKAPIPFKPVSDYRTSFGCKEKIAQYDMGPFGGNIPPKPGFYQDASVFRLERHYTGMIEVGALKKHPECIGAMLADNLDNPNPLVFIIFDSATQKPVYRIARISDVLKR